ncbi:MAG: PKD domain-containing protein [Bacteroidales bacterium]|nr:PKD domain-containing protein [Bacteroidales bacterium]
MKIRYIIIIIIISAFVFRVSGQIDNEFWFAAPDITDNYGPNPSNGAPINLHFTALYATTVTISQPLNPLFTPVVFSLADLEHKSIRLDELIPINFIETYPRALTDPTAIQSKGFHITAYPGEVSVYYELDNKLNKDIIVLKGSNGLGREFYVSTQNVFPNYNFKLSQWSGFVIVASDDDTKITVYPNDDLLHFTPYPPFIEITLDKGETYAFRAASIAGIHHINGVRVVSDKDIAITVYDDAMHKERITGGTSWDLFGDQIVPIDIIGDEYLVMKGFVENSPLEDKGERIFITATAANTQVYIDDNPVAVTTIANAGDVFAYDIVNSTTLVKTSAPVYINHITGFEADLGGAILPPIGECTGSYDVPFSRSPDPSESYFLNIMVRNDTTSGSPLRNQAVHNFTLTSNGVTTPIPHYYFEYILDSAYAVLKRDPAVTAFIGNLIEPGREALVQNAVALFHLGVINGHINTGCKYGYFSDYGTSGALAGIGGSLGDMQDVFCDLDPIRLVASGGTTYEWWCVSHPSATALLSSTTVAAPFFSPLEKGDYYFNVRISGPCSPSEILTLRILVWYRPVAEFDIDIVEGCSPFTSTITHKVNLDLADEMLWYFNYPYGNEANQDTLTNPFTWKFPENNTDSLVSYTVKLFTWGPFNTCPDSREKIVKIRPAVKADFEITGDTAGCHPFIVDFNNLSTGHLTSGSYFWSFGDKTFEYDSLPSHTYYNFSDKDTVYPVTLVVTSPMECRDTAIKEVNVFPYIRAQLAIDTKESCSPLISVLNPGGSICVDTFFWKLTYPDITMDYERETPEIININYSDTTYTNGPDTINVEMAVQNQWGCADTIQPQKLVIYPNPEAILSVDTNRICHGLDIHVTNHSKGINQQYYWNFGDGTSVTDSTGTEYYHTYYNRSDADMDYYITLNIVNEFFCIDRVDTVILVHPFIKADFLVDKDDYCSPVNATILNQSHRVAQYEWDFGDGSPLSNTSLPVFYHQFVNPNDDRDTSYTIKLKVTSPELCTDSTDWTITLLPQVIADYTITDPTEGCSPLTIALQNNSKGKDLSYLWQFGNSYSNTDSAIFSRTLHHYSAEDSVFNISLTAMNTFGCDSTISKTVTVYSYVQAAFTTDNVGGCSPLPVNTFNYSSEGSKYFQWSFGDGSTSNLEEPAYTYLNDGTDLETNIMQLVVKNDHECYDTARKEIMVYPRMIADFSADNYNGCQPLPVTFTNTSNILTGTTFIWDFDDGSFYTGITPDVHTFSNDENTLHTHNVKMTAINRFGCTDSAESAINVASYIHAFFVTDRPAICSGDNFTINRSGSAGGINLYMWDFENDGIVDLTTSDPIFNHTYSNTGISPISKVINLRVSNEEGCEDTWSKSVMVNPAVTADFEFDNSEPCYPTATLIQNTSSNLGIVATKFMWDMGDGYITTTDDQFFEHQFPNFDNSSDAGFTVTLVSESDYQCKDTIQKFITIHPKPKADYDVPVSVGCSPFTVRFNNKSIGENLSFFWDFDNGNSSFDINPEETFINHENAIIRRDVSLIAQTAFGCADTIVKRINAFPEVNVDFSASEWQGCSPLKVSFDGNPENHNIVTWYSDNEPFSSIEDPDYRFENNTTGNLTYNIRLSAKSLYNCSDDTVKQIVVYPSPVADFVYDPVVQDFNTATDITEVSFTNYTNHQESGIWDYQWSYGDGTSDANDQNSFIKGYTIWGDINNNNKILVGLTASNKNNPECSDNVVHEIVINPPLPQVNIEEDMASCSPFTVSFSSDTKYIYEDSYYWEFGENNSVSTEPEPTYTFTEPGTYVVKLTIQGDGGTNWDYKRITVYPQPAVDFVYSPELVLLASQTEDPTPVKYFNSTQPEGSYFWDFGDGSTSTEKNPIHIYTEAGEYYITLMATTTEGCVDTFRHPIPVIVEGARLIEFPNAIVLDPAGPASEYYDPSIPDPRIFRPVTQGVKRYRLEIYNRWGELIFVSEDVNKGWNGYVKGEPAKQDVYVWKVNVTFTDGKPYVAAGDVTLLINKR